MAELVPAIYVFPNVIARERRGARDKSPIKSGDGMTLEKRSILWNAVW
jgi:hypothetical protein